jgi:hypothetical protein
MDAAMNTIPGFHTVDTSTAAYSESLKRAHDLAQARCLRMEMIAKFWAEHPEASHIDFEQFLRELSAAETRRVRSGLVKP